jgi:NDP-sugar pyrophosphorylase family protein
LGKVVDYATREDAFNGDESRSKLPSRLQIPVVIMAGGKGTRLEPFTRILPKPLVPIGEKTVIEIIMTRFQDFGLDHFYISINHMSKIIKAYFEERQLKCKISYLEEDEPLGTAGSLRLLQGKVEGPIFVSNCDNIIETDYANLHAFHMENRYDITLVASLKEFNIPYGVCEVEKSGSLSIIREKPEYNFLVNTGLYIVNDNLIRTIPEKTTYHMTDLINSVKKAGGNVGVYPIGDNSWIDIGAWSEYRNAINTLEGKVVAI